MMSKVKIIECPRDAMQGLNYFVPTEIKLKYLNLLLEVGFDTLDFGSFVSAKAIPQLRDTHQITRLLESKSSPTKLLAIVANERGAQEAVEHKVIDYLGYPFSISETFQMRNTNSNLEQSFERVKRIMDIVSKHDKDLILYISMAFGNPYGDPWNSDIISFWLDKLRVLSCKTIALSDTIGVATPESISYIFSHLIPVYTEMEFGAHFHTLPNAWEEKIQAAYDSGCRRFDGAIKGYGGCPMAKDVLTGNMPTEHIIDFFYRQNEETGIKKERFDEAMMFSSKVFTH
ncbi:MAG TPA: hydroxymethylglutaryl-CoA lyase [Saprospiraceae bacterium]|nr:hydroxymethylglutaryl-CoA lyase [Saprospiraceae bacterium]